MQYLYWNDRRARASSWIDNDNIYYGYIDIEVYCSTNHRHYRSANAFIRSNTDRQNKGALNIAPEHSLSIECLQYLKIAFFYLFYL